MATKRKGDTTLPKSDLTKRIKYYLEKQAPSTSSVPVTAENIVDEVLNSPQIVSKV